MARKPYIGGHHVTLIHSGEEYFSVLVELIRSASLSIQIHVYILQADKIGITILDELLIAHKRGVKVFLLINYDKIRIPDLRKFKPKT